MNSKFLIITLILFIFSCSDVTAGNVNLDLTFNNTGYRIEQIYGFEAFGESVAVQNDGKIILGGSINSGGFLSDFVLMRVNPDGSLDTSFGSNGIVVTDMSYNDRADTIKIQPDGKILVAGDKYNFATDDDFVVVRYNSDGSLDNNFGINGTATINVRGLSDEHCYDMVLQLDGKILLAGTTAVDDNAQTGFLLARFNGKGKLDKTFGAGTGKSIYYLGANANATGTTALVNPDGKIDFGGYYTIGSTNFMMVNRFNADGTRTNEFGFSGSVAISTNKIQSMALQSDGKLIVQIGSKGKGSVFIRVLPSGNWDNSFGPGIIATSPVAATSMIIQADDKILLGGTFGANIAVSRLNANGTMDTTFDNDGYAIFSVPSQTCVGKSVALQSDNKIVVGGSCSNGSNNLAIFRFQENNFTE